MAHAESADLSNYEWHDHGEWIVVHCQARPADGNATVYGLAHAVLTKPARGVDAQDLVTIQRVDPGEATRPLHQYSDVEVFRSSARTLRNIAAVRLEPLVLRVGPITDVVRGASLRVFAHKPRL